MYKCTICVCVLFSAYFFRYRRDWIGGRVAFRVTCWLSEKGESLSWRDKMNGHTFLPIRKEEEEPEREWSGTWLQLDMEVIYWLIYVCGCSCVSIYTYFFQKILTRDPSKGGRCVHDGSGLTFSVVVKKKHNVVRKYGLQIKPTWITIVEWPLHHWQWLFYVAGIPNCSYSSQGKIVNYRFVSMYTCTIN